MPGPSSEPTPRWRGTTADERQRAQEDRLLRAAANLMAAGGPEAATADAVSRKAGTSKATYYRCFANREACARRLVDRAAEVAIARIVAAARAADPNTSARQRAGLRAFLDLVRAEPVIASAVLVHAPSAGPTVTARRDELLRAFGAMMHDETERGQRADGGGRFATPFDAIAVAGAIAELAALHVRSGSPTLDELEATAWRLIAALVVRAAG